MLFRSIDDDGASSNVFWRIFGIFGGADVGCGAGSARQDSANAVYSGSAAGSVD